MYKSQKYEHLIRYASEPSQEDFNLLKAISKDFTVSDQYAHDLDDALHEILELETNEYQSADKPETAAQTASEQQSAKNSARKTESKKSTTKAQEKIQREKHYNDKLEYDDDDFDWQNDFDLKEEFMALLKNLSAGINTASNPITSEQLSKELKKVLHDRKITFDDLDSALQDKISEFVSHIKFDLPDVETEAMPNPEIDQFQAIVDDVLLGHNVFLVGGAGTGKTYLAEQLVAKQALNRGFLTINCSQWTAPTEIIGGQTMDGYQEGKLIEAWQKGLVLILDELPKIDPNTAGLLNDALAKSKIKDAVIFNGRRESFVKHKNFAVIATGNIYPDKESMTYGANNKQDLSLLDRFAGSVYYIEKNPAIEKRIIQNLLVWSLCDKLRSAIEELKYDAQVSLRLMMNANDSLRIEMKRYQGKEDADSGKTLKRTIDNYLSTFTDVQRKNLKDKIRYSSFLEMYQYRTMDNSKTLF
jgi:MoxR-like ATPase